MGEGDTGGETLAQLADELYGLLPAEFTPARDAAVRRLRDADRVSDAAVVAGFRKPVVAAWALNRLRRADPDGLDELLGIGAELGRAQQNGDRAALRDATQRRRHAVSALLARIAELGDEVGIPIASGTREQLEQTLGAAVVDSGAAAAVRSGMLVTPLAPTGADPVDVSRATALKVEALTLTPAPSARDSRLAVAEEAEAVAERAERERERAEARLDSAESVRAELAESREQLRERLKALDRDLVAAEKKVAARQDEYDEASDAATLARAEARTARRAIR